ncbi:hypothetical protein YT1_0941 [Rhodococcus ruber]|nr:hypothetical protein YT1_0941 [Rhodococcus ruber]
MDDLADSWKEVPQQARAMPRTLRGNSTITLSARPRPDSRRRAGGRSGGRGGGVVEQLHAR